MAVTKNGEVEYLGVVLSTSNYTVRVSSDHAWVDSGNRTGIVYWDADTQVVRETAWEPDGSVVTVDAPPEVVAQAAEYTKVVDWLRAGINACHDRQLKQDWPKTGDKVMVVRGRKVPKGGPYTIVRKGKGNYGTYFDLRDEGGKVYRYVNTDNCVGIKATFDDLEYGEFFATIASKGHALYEQRTAILVFADHLEDQGDARAEVVRRYARSGDRSQ